MELVNQNLTDGVIAKADLVQGKLMLVTNVDAGILLGKLKVLVPGKIDDAFFDIFEAALKAVSNKVLVSEQIFEGVTAEAVLNEGMLTVTVSADSEVGIDKIKEIIPGKLDDAILEIFKTVLKGL